MTNFFWVIFLLVMLLNVAMIFFTVHNIGRTLFKNSNLFQARQGRYLMRGVGGIIALGIFWLTTIIMDAVGLEYETNFWVYMLVLTSLIIILTALSVLMVILTGGDDFEWRDLF